MSIERTKYIRKDHHVELFLFTFILSHSHMHPQDLCVRVCEFLVKQNSSFVSTDTNLISRGLGKIENGMMLINLINFLYGIIVRILFILFVFSYKFSVDAVAATKAGKESDNSAAICLYWLFERLLCLVLILTIYFTNL